MDARSVGLIVSGAIFLTVVTYGGAPALQAQELHASAVSVAPSDLPAVSPSVGVPETGMLTALQPAVAPEESLVAVVLPPKRVGFERLRRVLPYGTVHNPVTRYLTEEARVVAQDD